MRIKTLKLQNFRGYKEEIAIDFGDLTAFVGKNDIGKSTILEALDIFFNEGKGAIKMDKDDINRQAVAAGETEIRISVCFEELPEEIVIDATNVTSLQAEYLLNASDRLEIIKKYPNAGTAKTFVKANHPTNASCNDLLLKKNTELKKILDDNDIACADKTRNSVIRTAIWGNYCDDLQLTEVEIDITKGDTKQIWDKLQAILPLYSLFQSDRKNSDSDSEVQDPLSEATKQILNEGDLRERLTAIASEVETKLKDVSDRTLEKLRELNPDLANSLNPVIPQAESLKWADVFKKVSISSDEDIPINKRGSGVKRLVLLSFFRAEAERRRTERNSSSIIYAVEEPETSQHTEHQKILINSFLTLSETQNTQIIVTTHSPVLVKELEFGHLQLITIDDTTKSVVPVVQGQLPYPSLNEVNYLAFSEISEEYHNELYGFIEETDQLSAYKNGKSTMRYIKVLPNGNMRDDQIILTEYIRHQIHHPENTNNQRYTPEQLRESILSMREFVEAIVPTA